METTLSCVIIMFGRYNQGRMTESKFWGSVGECVTVKGGYTHKIGSRKGEIKARQFAFYHSM